MKMVRSLVAEIKSLGPDLILRVTVFVLWVVGVDLTIKFS